MKILAIETSCDETAIALLSFGGEKENLRENLKIKIIKNLVASQIKIHKPFGGVVPNLAKREHIKNLPILFSKIFNIKKIGQQKLNNIDLIAVTVGPGLEPALWTGINFAKDIQQKFSTDKSKPKLLGVSHLDGHLYSNIFEIIGKNKNKKLFPAIALIISGGHTILVKMESLIEYKKLGETVDDAVGEAFDKVARLLELPYPGGPEIEKIAKKGKADSINFPRPMLNQKNYNFSFSGLKTSILYYLRDNQIGERKKIAQAADIAVSFQKAAFDVLIKKTLRAVKEFNAKSIMISGGVAANKTLKKEFKKAIKKSDNPEINFLATKYPTDNAAMIAVAGYINYLRKKRYKLEANGNLGV